MVASSLLAAWREDPETCEAIKELREEVCESWSELHQAVAMDRADIVTELLAEGADVNKQLENPRCPVPPITIMPGLEKSPTVEIVQILLDAKADVNLGTEQGFSPILMPAQAGKTEVVRLMLEAKALPDVAMDGRTALDVACWYSKETDNGTLEVIKLLLEHGADPKNIHEDNDEYFTSEAVSLLRK
eukprot:gnl/TRDRNA2_/TRDRNA2_91484_c0_seq1.p1 gnl/TRDRNA2_/TRDRNA2_91484_c0~~gnl/TRDRNA2_/TRDRNA2_91484_c0_seq1.p1  ORF type:complete len:188 (+),score=34.46 gnl/TRDRNA2_/TRDRNA2_91484_c0_seq1:142-705(+)